MELLGWKCEDQVTGLTGIVESYSEYLGGTRQYCIQPKGDGHKVPDGWNVDMERVIKCVGQKAPMLTPKPLVAKVANLGDEAMDTVTKTKGTVTKIFSYLNGCRRYEIAEKQLKSNSEVYTIVIDGSRVKVLKAATVVPPKVKTGGPREPAPRY